MLLAVPAGWKAEISSGATLPLPSPTAAWITAAAPAPTIGFAEHWLLSACLCSSSHSVQMLKPCTMSVQHGCRLLERIRLLPWQSCQVCGRGRARLCSHAPKAVKKPENTAQSDVNKQVLHILPSQIFRSLKRIGCVIESSRRQLYPVLPVLTQPITQSFIWQLDKVTCFHMGEQFSDKALQPEHWKPHYLIPWTLISTGWKRNFPFFAPALPPSPLPAKVAFQHQEPVFFVLLNLTCIFTQR